MTIHPKLHIPEHLFLPYEKYKAKMTEGDSNRSDIHRDGSCFYNIVRHKARLGKTQWIIACSGLPLTTL